MSAIIIDINVIVVSINHLRVYIVKLETNVEKKLFVSIHAFIN